jgi:membrane protein YdbS with pleckstrin-like domain
VFAYLGAHIFGFILGLVGLVFLQPPVTPLGVFLILIGILVNLYAYLERRSRRFTITTTMIRLDFGILSHNTSEIPLRKVQAMKVRQGFIDGMAGVGNIGFSSASAREIEVLFFGVHNPYAIRDLVKKHQPSVSDPS